MFSASVFMLGVPVMLGSMVAVSKGKVLRLTLRQSSLAP